MDERKRDSMIAYLRHRMEEHGIEPDDLASAIAGDQVRQKAARYQNATGDTWTGDGEMPQWLKQAILLLFRRRRVPEKGIRLLGFAATVLVSATLMLLLPKRPSTTPPASSRSNRP